MEKGPTYLFIYYTGTEPVSANLCDSPNSTDFTDLCLI